MKKNTYASGAIWTGALIMVAAAFLSWLLNGVEADTGSHLSAAFLVFIKDYAGDFIVSGALIVAGGVASKSLTKGVAALWESDVKESLIESINDAASKTRRIVSAKTLQEVINSTEPVDIVNSLDALFSRAFGKHCSAKESFYTALKDRYMQFLKPEIPHRSKASWDITVEENDDGTFTWHEVVSYNLHTISKDSDYTKEIDGSPISYNHGVASMAEIPLEKVQEFKLQCSIDEKLEFDTTRDLEADENNVKVTNNEHLTTRYENGSLTLIFKKTVMITKAMTRVETKETTVLTDTHYVSYSKIPTCGARLNIHLPPGWAFDEINFGQRQDWTYHQHPPNVLSGSTDRWLFPGIAFMCKWKRLEQNTVSIKKAAE